MSEVLFASDKEKVRKATRRASAAQAALETAIRDAHYVGLSLRSIAVLADMSHESVRRIVNASEKRKGRVD